MSQDLLKPCRVAKQAASGSCSVQRSFRVLEQSTAANYLAALQVWQAYMQSPRANSPILLELVHQRHELATLLGQLLLLL